VIILWVQFALITSLILFAGANLSKYGDVIAEKTGLGRTWVGVILMASVTSLPELLTGVSSVAVFNLPNIAVGDVFGSCMFNLLILAGLDLLSRSTPISARAHRGHVLSASFGILMLAVAVLRISAGQNLPAVGWVGLETFVLLVVYLVAMRTVFLFEKKRIAEFVEHKAEVTRYEGISLRRAYLSYGWNAVLVLAAASYLPYLGDRIATATGLGTTFVGSIFIALTTSLPEVVVSLSALRLGAIDLAFSNLLGSNLFNMAILAVDDLLYSAGPLLTIATAGHIVTANAAIAMTAITAVGLTYRASKKRLPIAWDSLAILAVYSVAVWTIFLIR
jgi:cation:H+ antiporter